MLDRPDSNAFALEICLPGNEEVARCANRSGWLPEIDHEPAPAVERGIIQDDEHVEI